MNEELKKDTSPTTEEWYKTTLAIKKFCEEHELGLSDTHYGWLSSLFYELKEKI